jgi:hypothetical protein
MRAVRNRRSALRGLSALAAVAVVLAAAPAGESASPGCSGRWRVDGRHAPTFGGSRVFTLIQRGSTLTGTFSWQFKAEHGFGAPPCFTGHGGTLRGSAKGRTLTATLAYPRREGHQKATASFQAALSANGLVSPPGRDAERRVWGRRLLQLQSGAGANGPVTAAAR